MCTEIVSSLPAFTVSLCFFLLTFMYFSRAAIVFELDRVKYMKNTCVGGFCFCWCCGAPPDVLGVPCAGAVSRSRFIRSVCRAGRKTSHCWGLRCEAWCGATDACGLDAEVAAGLCEFGWRRGRAAARAAAECAGLAFGWFLSLSPPTKILPTQLPLSGAEARVLSEGDSGACSSIFDY